MTSLFDIFKIGVGPSSSHTMGPMRACCRFALELNEQLEKVARVRIELYGSLALTGIGHAVDRAVLLGLSGLEPATIDPASISATVAEIRFTGRLKLAGRREITFNETEDLVFLRDQMNPPGATTVHPNGIRLIAMDAVGGVLSERTFFSVGGGFIVEDGERETSGGGTRVELPHPFHSASELLERASRNHLRIDELMLANECARLASASGGAELKREELEAEVKRKILLLWRAMQQCVAQGMATEGILPGGLNVRRRAHKLAEQLKGRERAIAESNPVDPLAALDWLTVFAMAVNEENAAGGRVVTAPTNGAAGVIPAVGHYYERFTTHASEEGILRYFLTSAAIGILYKENASISGAEVGCQGEVGVACSMAAGGLVAALGGTNDQVEHAAEIGMEHNLGMTCDPIGGLVQIPCIERNAMGSVKAVHASRIAMNETGTHKVSLDQVIRTMYLTGLDMQSRYKETSLAGLALNIIEC
jgi:L-serine dehydratase